MDHRSALTLTAPRDEALDLQAISWHHEDNFREGLLIKAFGVDAAGRSCALTIKGFRPHFFVANVKLALPMWKYATDKNGAVRLREVVRKDFWGFRGDDERSFLRIDCVSIREFRAAVQRCTDLGLELYESNVDPLLRFFHVQGLRPCGWLRVPPNKHVVNRDLLASHCQIDVHVGWQDVHPLPEREDMAPMRVLSFDLECTSAHGDFPVAVKTYRKLATELYADHVSHETEAYALHLRRVRSALVYCLGHGEPVPGFTRVNLKRAVPETKARDLAGKCLNDVCNILRRKAYAKPMFGEKAVADRTKDRGYSWNILKGPEYAAVHVETAANLKRTKDQVLEDLDNVLCGAIADTDTSTRKRVPKRLRGDPIIQIGSTFHVYGQQQCTYRHIVTLGSCEPIEGADVVACDTEEELLLKWAELVQGSDPDVIAGYNILGFDFPYLRDRAEELGIAEMFDAMLGRIKGRRTPFKTTSLSSSALGDNVLRFYDMPGRCIIDMMKVVQRDHRLDCYKLDHVAETFLGERKHGIGPGDIFRLQDGSAADRRTVAEYCLQDCALVNRLLIRLETIANNVGMGNVCLVPLSYIFTRGQGVKVFSLVAKQCADEGFVIPTRTVPEKTDDEEDGYEGAIVLDPETGMYTKDVVAVMDYNSLYPSSIISENLSHDTIVLDAKYDNLPGVEYNDVCYDVYSGSGDARRKVGEHRCRFAASKQGIIPRILNKLLAARKATRQRMAHKRVRLPDGTVLCGTLMSGGDTLRTVDGTAVSVDAGSDVTDLYDAFQKAVLEGLQLAYKVTANSIYGQMGARTSAVYLKDIAACTTAVGRSMILKAKRFMETECGARVVYGDTDSIFCVFPPSPPGSPPLEGDAALVRAMQLSEDATTRFNALLKPPQFLESEKCFYPFILLSKKRYIGMLYPHGSLKGKRKEMGVALKRRDNAPIVKHVLGGVVDILLRDRDLQKSIDFLRACLKRLIAGGYEMEDLVVTKSLRATYADPTRIAHKVLAERMGERDPGSKPQANDRVKYVYVVSDARLQGDRIEDPDFVRKHRLQVDYRHYVSNQIMNPVVQLFAIVLEQLPGYHRRTPRTWAMELEALQADGTPEAKARERWQKMREKDVEEYLFRDVLRKLDLQKARQNPITKFFSSIG